MTAPTLTQAEYKRLKTRLTRKLNVFTNARIELQTNSNAEVYRTQLLEAAEALWKECVNALLQFEDEGWPDDWHHWNCARDDAWYQIQRLER